MVFERLTDDKSTLLELKKMSKKFKKNTELDKKESKFITKLSVNVDDSFKMNINIL